MPRSVGDVLGDGPGEEPRVLEHHRVALPDRGPRRFPDVPPFELHFPAVRVVEAHEEIDDRGLPRSRGSDDGRRHAGVHAEGEIVQDLPLRGVAEIHVADVLLSEDFRVLSVDEGPRDVRDLLLLVQQAEDPFGRRSRGLELVDDVRRLVDRAAELAGVEHEGGDVADGDPPRQIEQGAEDRHQRQADVVDEIDGGTDHRAVVVRVEIGVRRALVLPGETGGHGGLRGIGAHGLLSREAFLRVAVQLAELSRTRPEQGPEPVRHHGGRHHRERDRHGEDQAEPRGDREHHDEGPGHRHDGGRDLHEVRRQGGVDGVDVVGDPGDDVPGLDPVEIVHLHPNTGSRRRNPSPPPGCRWRRWPARRASAPPERADSTGRTGRGRRDTPTGSGTCISRGGGAP